MVAGSSLVEAVRFVGWRMAERGSTMQGRLCWRCWMLCLTLAASMGGGTRWEPYRGWRYAPCCAVPAVSTPSANGAGTRGWRFLRHWGSPGTLLPASPPCNWCSAGWTGMLSNPPWAVAEVPGAGGGRGVGHRRQAVAGNPRGATARNASGGSLRPSAGYFGGAAGGEGQEE